MIKLIIADDERIIREGLAEEVDWTAINIEVVGVAKDGNEAYSLVIQKDPEIIITDIRMPFLDGLELIEKIKEIKPGIEIIIISGHDEFQYAQRAMKLGVTEYILKPIKPEVLLETVERIKKKVVNDIEHKKYLDILEKKAKINEPVFKEWLLNKILSQSIDVKSLNDEVISILCGKYSFFCIILLRFSEIENISEDTKDSYRYQFNEALYSELKDVAVKKDDIIIIFQTNYKCIICVMGSSQQSVKHKISVLKNDLFEKFTKSHVIIMSVGQIKEGIKSITESMKEAELTLKYSFFCEINTVIEFNKIIQEDELRYIQPFETIIDQVIDSIKQKDKEAVKSKLYTLIDLIKDTNNNYSVTLKLFISNFFYQVLSLQKYIKNDEHCKKVIFSEYEKSLSCTSVSSLVNILERISNYFIDQIQINDNGGYQYIIKKVADYVERNYAWADMGLSDVAAFANISPSYLSMIFKQETGKTFIEFLTDVRIAKAKEILKLSDAKNYEIAEKVGYKHASYFCTIFKKFTGLTPLQYKISVR